MAHPVTSDVLQIGSQAACLLNCRTVQISESLFLDALPTEIIHTVLSCALLDVRDLLHCRQVCRQLRTLIDSSVGLQYKIELVEAGMENGPRGEILPTATRLAKLRKHQDAWLKVEWTEETPVGMDSANAWALFGGIMGFHVPGIGFNFVTVPSVYRDISPKEWSVDGEFHCMDFSFDPSQDLLVSLEQVNYHSTDIRLLSLSSGGPHPLAAVPNLNDSLDIQSPDEWTFDIKVRGKYLGIMIFNEGEERSSTEFRIWNWKTGDLNSDVVAVEFDSFLFLTDDLVMISVTDPTPCNRLTPSLEVFLIHSSISHTLDMFPVAIFHLPAPHQRRDMLPVELIADSPPRCAGPIPFTTIPENYMIAASFQVYNVDDDESKKFAVFFPLSSILKRVDPGSDGRHESTENAPVSVFTWLQWGPSETHITYVDPSHDWLCFVQGMKAIIQGPDSSYRLFNFNPYSLRHHHHPDNTQYLFDTTTMSRHGEVFENVALTTSLPCRVTAGSLPFESIVRMMLSEDGIIAVSKHESQLLILSF